MFALFKVIGGYDDALACKAACMVGIVCEQCHEGQAIGQTLPP
ncbi:hypothetical protein [Prochlorococcus sp. MIT 1342]